MDDQLSATITAMGGGFSDSFVPVITAETIVRKRWKTDSEQVNPWSSIRITTKREQKVKLFAQIKHAWRGLNQH